MEEYDLIVIGAGSAGLVVALAGAALKKKTLLIEKELPGGDCTHYGCIPSKSLIHIAQLTKEMQKAKQLGIISENTSISWKTVREKVAEIVDRIYQTETPEKLQQQGVHVVKAQGAFVDEHTIEAGKKRYRGKKIVICTGAHARIPTFKGSETIHFETNETIFTLKKFPKKLAIIGGGPIGCEMAQAFARLGSQVHIIERGDILSREEPDARELLRKALLADGVTLHTSTDIKKGEKVREGYKITTSRGQIKATHILAAVGRIPNTTTLQLSNAGVEVDQQGRITTDEHMRTSTPHIYAAGDCTATYQFTHVAEQHARVIINNALIPVISKSFSAEYIPWVTFTDPEIAHVGKTQPQLMGLRYEVLEWKMDENDRARTEEDTTGFVKLYVTPLRGKILGASIVGTNAGELLATVCLAMQQGLSARHLSDTLLAYPTRAQSIRWAADKYYRDVLAQKFKEILP